MAYASSTAATRLAPLPAAEMAGTGRPTVSLCIPAFQAQRYLRATIDSVLAQTHGDFEVVIVDNNSTDGTREIIAGIDDPRVRVATNPTTLSMVENFNLAVSLCRGQFVKLICADDTLEPDCIQTQAAVLRDNPEVMLVAARTDFIDDDGFVLRPARGLRGVVGRHPGQCVVRQIVRSGSNPIGAPVAVMFRRVDFERCGGFDDDLLFAMDMDLWVRLLRDGDFVGVPRTLASFRVGSESATALTSAGSQLAQQLGFAAKLCSDPRWKVAAGDRVVGRFNAVDMQFRRSLLTQLSRLRAVRKRRGSAAPK
jgi:glycosyltransferase involved in cell wall biosynthesis